MRLANDTNGHENSFHLDSFTAICVMRGNFSQLQRQRWLEAQRRCAWITYNGMRLLVSPSTLSSK